MENLKILDYVLSKGKMKFFINKGSLSNKSKNQIEAIQANHYTHYREQENKDWEIKNNDFWGGSKRDNFEFEVEEALPELKEPPMYQVYLNNDDYTPMEFVVDILVHFFGLDEGDATQVMWQVHTRGKGACGVFTRDIAETKVAQVNEYAQQSEYPLLCGMEPLT